MMNCSLYKLVTLWIGIEEGGRTVITLMFFDIYISYLTAFGV